MKHNKEVIIELTETQKFADDAKEQQIKNVQKQNTKLDSSIKDKDKLIGELKKEVSELKKEVVQCKQSV